ncbi:MAG TPA: hypothetical protein VFX03_11230, partial [Thermomicrobiales bacterium]|nr:hypothetical protein [Thermomicrobiales bacterium]
MLVWPAETVRTPPEDTTGLPPLPARYSGPIAKSFGAEGAEVRSKVTLAMSALTLRTPMKMAEASALPVLSPSSVKSPIRTPSASKTWISAVKEPKEFVWICAPTPATGVANVMVMSGPPPASQSSGVPGSKLPLHPLLWSRRPNVPPLVVTVAERPFVELTVAGLLTAVK